MNLLLLLQRGVIAPLQARRGGAFDQGCFRQS